MKKLIILSIIFFSTQLACGSDLNLAIDLFQKGKNSQSLDAYNKIVVRAYNNYEQYEALLGVSKCQFALKQYQEAIDSVEKVISSVSNIEIKCRAIKFKGDIYYFQNDFFLATNAYNSLITDFPDSNEVPICEMQVVKCLLKLKAMNDAKKKLLDMKARYKDLQFLKQIDFYLKRIKNDP